MSSPEIINWLASTPEASVEPAEDDYLDPVAVANLIETSPESIAIIDLRKNDFIGGKIKGALNIPAQSIYHSISDLYELFEKAGKKQIIVHCVSSRQRATRTWGWFTDYENTKNESDKLKISILKGGFNAFKSVPGASELIEN